LLWLCKCNCGTLHHPSTSNGYKCSPEKLPLWSGMLHNALNLQLVYLWFKSWKLFKMVLIHGLQGIVGLGPFLEPCHFNHVDPKATDLASRQPRFVLSRWQKMWLSSEPAEKNNRLSRQEKCGLITEKSIITVFNTCKLFATAIFTVPYRRFCIFFVFMYKTHLLSLKCSDNKTHPRFNMVLMHLFFAV